MVAVSRRRKSWDEYFMDIAFAVAERSTCPRRSVGAVLVKNREIKATGYNGAPRRLPHCTEVGCQIENDHCVRTVHAEQNAIIFSNRADREEASIYVTDFPCRTCLLLLINSGIRRIVYAREYRFAEEGLEICREADVDTLHLPRPEPADEAAPTAPH